MPPLRMTPFRIFLIAQIAGVLLIAGAGVAGAWPPSPAALVLLAAGAAAFAFGLYAGSRYLQRRIDVLSDALDSVREELYLAVNHWQATDPAARRALAEDYSRRHADMARIFESANQARRRDLLLAGSLGTAALEVGCSTGAIAAHFHQSGFECVGMDLSHFALAHGLEGVPYVQGDACRLPFADGSFDTVLLPEVLEHLEDPEAALRDAVRVARKRVVASIPLGPMWDPTHCRIYSRESALALFEQAPELTILHTAEVEPWIVIACERQPADR